MKNASETTVQSGDALIIVDMQNDFLPGGSLAVPEGDQVIAPLNQYIDLFLQKHLPIYATRDWHPVNHCSFKKQGGPWPPHCIADSEGARFSSDLKLPANTMIVSKGTTSEKDAYSGFEDTELAEMLRSEKIKRVFIGGLATDYCVLNTVKDALTQGFETVLLQDAVRAVNVQPEDGEKAKDEMQNAGAKTVTVEKLS